MHILFITDNFFPEVNAPASRTFEHARHWVRRGVNVTVITSAPNFPKGKVYEGYRNRLYDVEILEGITVIRVWTYMAPNTGQVRRLLDFLSFMVSSFIASFWVKNVDLVVGTSPQFFTVISAWLCSKFKSKPFIFELRDLWPESIRVLTGRKGSKLLKFFDRLEMFMYRRADAIVSVTHSFKKNLTKRGIDHRKIFIVTNGVDLDLFSYENVNKKLRNELAIENKFVVGYLGTIGMAHALDVVVKCAATAQARGLEDILFIMVGDGADKKRLQALTLEAGLKNLLFFDAVNKLEAVSFLAMFDLSVIHLKKSDLFKTVIPSKIFESMALGKPILLGVEGEAAEILESCSAGALFQPESSKSLLELITQFQNDKIQYNIISKNAKISAKQYNRASLAEKYIAIFNEIISSQK